MRSWRLHLLSVGRSQRPRSRHAGLKGGQYDWITAAWELTDEVHPGTGEPDWYKLAPDYNRWVEA